MMMMMMRLMMTVLVAYISYEGEEELEGDKDCLGGGCFCHPLPPSFFFLLPLWELFSSNIIMAFCLIDQQKRGRAGEREGVL